MKDASTVREDLVQFIRNDLIGPAHGEFEVLEDSPKIRYAAGVLFPRESEHNESDAAAGIEGDTGEATEADVLSYEQDVDKPSTDAPPEDTQHDDTVTLANAHRPSAIGISFVVEASCNKLVVEPHAAVYDTETVLDDARARTVWRRVPLELPPAEVILSTKDASARKLQLTEGLKLCAVVRALSPSRRLVTISLFNDTTVHTRAARHFFQVGFKITAATGDAVFPEYRTLHSVPGDAEETALSMLYRERRVFAVGHGCAAEWEAPDGAKARAVRTTTMPAVVVPPVVPLSFDAPALSMEFLSGLSGAPAREVIAALEALCDAYEHWIAERNDEVSSLSSRFQATAHDHLRLCRTALDRMRAGVNLLAGNKVALRAFMLVNRVMLMQQHHSRLRRRVDAGWEPLPEAGAYRSDWSKRFGYWRAFQIAFLLMTLRGFVADEHAVALAEDSVLERDLVDLIWFPTGGGKTEAYLGVTAFLIFMSRLSDASRSGCRVLMRYTLRLLTSQQFQRAASLICACETVRRGDPDTFGAAPISIGLWVGESLTPNREKDALNRLNKLVQGKDDRNPFQLLSCPWCGTELDDRDHLGYTERAGRQIFKCPASGCPFSKRSAPLPIAIVDDAIYASPPTLLIGTVDKFAMLAWREAAGAIFEKGGGPDLIIQDELHLIAGPLGSMVGLYESAIDYLCSRGGRRPKIIASTATIRGASAQCRALYDRPMFQFPPPGLSASDSYFACEDVAAPGRMYVGFLPTASSSPLTAQIRSVVSLQQGAFSVAPEPTDALDPYWTLVQYFSSLKELGRAATFLTADIPEFLPVMHRRYALQGKRRRFLRSSEELTSRKNENEIPKILTQLEQKYSQDATYDTQALDTLLATNMISVGVDVDRLGLMMIVTQPKGTSEYIQASSRVGRRHPGLVFTLYNASRPRDRSHYEQFVAYHQAYYRFVEPTSVTPFSPPALERALHGVLVIGARHAVGWRRPRDFDRGDPKFNAYLEFLRERVRSTDPDHLKEFEDMLATRLMEWESRAPESWGDFGARSDDTQLMRPAGSPCSLDGADTWETPTSMRSVDVECSAEVVPRYIVLAGEG